MTTLEQSPIQDAGTVLDLVEERVRRHPGATALIDVDGTEIGYGEFGARCDALAARLVDAGIRPDEPVVVRLDRSAEAIVAMVAVMRAGGAYTPVDAGWPAARYAAVVRKVGASWLIGDRDLPPEVAVTGLRRLPRGGAPAPASEGPALDGPAPDGLAYILHTSGSSGTPKGVAMTHRGLARLIGWQVHDGEPGLTTAVFTPTGFDVIFQEVFSTLATGGRLCMLSERDRMDPERLLDVLDRRSVERIFMPYVALQRLAKAAERLGRVPSALRHVVTAGERLIITESIARFFDALPGCRLDNHYGPTETHLVTSEPLRGDARDWPQVPPIGTPVSGADVYLLDDDLRAAPAGEPGEVYVSGASLARGYANAPALTAERFLPDPFVPAARMYRTGDRALLGADGRLHFLGRAGDEQVKVRGYRVEPAEVEIALSGHPKVRDVAVGVRRLVGDVDGLVAYVVAEAPVPPVAELSEQARATLPSYMIPSRYVFLEALPLTATGKIDRAALAAVEPAAVEPAAADEERPAGATIDLVAAIWRRVLGHDEFEPDDDFFDVGGDSLLATWVVAELGRLVGREVKLSVLLADSTLEGIAEALDDLGTRPESAHSASEILTLSPGRANRALFMFHTLGGEVFGYRELARTLTTPLRVLGVRWAEDGYGGRSLEELARVHAAQIRTLQPEGPYLLAGWSFGGVLAFEVAGLLTADGAEVEFLGLLDANPLLDPITGLPPDQTTYHAMLTRVLDRLDLAETGDEPVDVSALADDADWVGLMGAVPAGVTARHLRRHLSLAREGMRAVTEYRPGVHGGGIELFQAGATGAEVRRRLLDRLRDVTAGPVHDHVVPGDHGGILRGANAAALAEAMDAALGRLAKEGSDAA
ncbi:amino acid adenylation domain-containing protein [Spirillospora sp. CA-255316]